MIGRISEPPLDPPCEQDLTDEDRETLYDQDQELEVDDYLERQAQARERLDDREIEWDSPF